MRAELQAALFKKYPELFYQKNLDKTQTCMCWGIDTDDGWYKILDNLCESIVRYCNKTQTPLPQFTQVKEKFGYLNVYTEPTVDKIHRLIEKAEQLSYKTCEVCSKPGKPNKEGWIKVLCPSCRKKRNNL